MTFPPYWYIVIGLVVVALALAWVLDPLGRLFDGRSDFRPSVPPTAGYYASMARAARKKPIDFRLEDTPNPTSPGVLLAANLMNRPGEWTREASYHYKNQKRDLWVRRWPAISLFREKLEPRATCNFRLTAGEEAVLLSALRVWDERAEAAREAAALERLTGAVK